MSFFKEVEGEGAVIQEGGAFKQVPIATRDGYLFAKVGSVFYRLMADGSTSKAGGKMRLDFMSFDGQLCKDALGRLCTPQVSGAVSLAKADRQKLIGGSS